MAKIVMTLSMVIFGTIGIFRRYIPLSSGMIAFARAMIGTLFLIIVMTVSRKKLSWKVVKANWGPLVIGGVLLSFNWILLFEAYQHTGVATATLCYYMAPVFVILTSPIFLKEKLTTHQLVCALAALLGMVFVSGVIGQERLEISEWKGILFGIGAAVMYAAIVIFNKKIRDVPAYDKTIMQLGIAAIVLLPYIIFTERWAEINITPQIVGLLLFVGIVHTGVAYAMYFGMMDRIRAQSAALISYVDPIVAILLAALILHEEIGRMEIVGAILVLGATMVSERKDRSLKGQSAAVKIEK